MEGFDRFAFRIVEYGTDRFVLGKEAHRAVARAVRGLLSAQSPSGYWQGHAPADVMVDCQVALLFRFFHRHEEPVATRLVETLLSAQLPSGGWARGTAAHFSLDVSVLAYLTLKLYGVDPACEAMHRARRAVRAAGGADSCGGLVRFFLALFGQIPYEVCPQFHSARMVECLRSAGKPLDNCALVLLAALALVRAIGPVARIEALARVQELFLEPPQRWHSLGVASCLERGPLQKRAERVFGTRLLANCSPLSSEAVTVVRRFLEEYCEFGPHLSIPGVVWAIVALSATGSGHSQAAVHRAMWQLESWIGEDPDTGGIHVRPPTSAVMDTALTLRGLAAAGTAADTPAIRRSQSWLLKQCGREAASSAWPEDELSSPPAVLASPFAAESSGIASWDEEPERSEIGDAQLPNVPISLALLAMADQFQAEQPRARVSGASRHGASFAFADCKDRVKTALWQRFRSFAAELRRAWFGSQNSDGGWIPECGPRRNGLWRRCFSRFWGEQIEASHAGTTALVLECLGRLGLRAGNRVVNRALGCLCRLQHADGRWTDGNAAHTLFTTCQALRAMHAVGIGDENEAYASGINWVAASALPEGGWGCAPGLPPDGTAGFSQADIIPTAYGVLVLSEAGLADRCAVLDGVHFLLAQQQPDGLWCDSSGWPHQVVASPKYLATCLAVRALAAWMHNMPDWPGGRTAWTEKGDQQQASGHLRLAVVGEPEQPGRMAARSYAA